MRSTTSEIPTLKLTALEARNFKCLKNVKIEFKSNFNVFVGRNNTGKSTILDIFTFLQEASLNPQEALKKRGATATDLVWGRVRGTSAIISLHFDVPDVLRDEVLKMLAERKAENLVTKLKVQQVARSHFLRRLTYTVEIGDSFSETITTPNPVNGDRLMAILRVAVKKQRTVGGWNQQTLWNSTDDTTDSLQNTNVGPNYDLPKSIPPLLFKNIDNIKTDSNFAVEWLNGFVSTIYHSVPHRKPEYVQNVGSLESLDSEGRYLVDVLHTLRNNEEEVFEQIERDLKVLVEGVTGLSTPTERNTTTTRIKENLGTSGTLHFDLKQTSAGTAQLLILLTQLHTRPPNSLVLIEELESLLHPRAQAEFARILKELSRNLSIMVSTQSPVIAAEARNDSLFLVSKQGGETTVRPFSDEIAPQLIEEMGIRSSYNFEANTVVFVEGIFDEAVFRRWLEKLEICNRVALIESGGYSNIQFATNAKILRRQAVKVHVFAVVDGDARRRGDYSQVKAMLGIPATQLLELDEDNLEAILAVPTEILATFPSIGKTEQEIAALLESAKAEENLKEGFRKLLHPVGGYTKENAAAIAAHVEPPQKFVEFFTTVNETDRRT